MISPELVEKLSQLLTLTFTGCKNTSVSVTTYSQNKILDVSIFRHTAKSTVKESVLYELPQTIYLNTQGAVNQLDNLIAKINRLYNESDMISTSEAA